MCVSCLCVPVLQSYNSEKSTNGSTRALRMSCSSERQTCWRAAKSASTVTLPVILRGTACTCSVTSLRLSLMMSDVKWLICVRVFRFLANFLEKSDGSMLQLQDFLVLIQRQLKQKLWSEKRRREKTFLSFSGVTLLLYVLNVRGSAGFLTSSVWKKCF